LRQTLAPIYSQLIEKARIAPSTQLTSPEKTALDIGNTGRLAQIFQHIAKTAGMTLESVTPDAQSVDQGNGLLMVEVIFRGEFLNVQPLINTIVGQSFVDRIQGVKSTCAALKRTNGSSSPYRCCTVDCLWHAMRGSRLRCLDGKKLSLPSWRQLCCWVAICMCFH
jgi:hypothetical protein